MSKKNIHKESVLCIHQEGHIGGGQVYFQKICEALQAKHKVHAVENLSFLKLLQIIISSSNKIVVWSIYSDFSWLPYFVSWFLGKKNILILYGTWFYEFTLPTMFSWKKYWHILEFRYQALVSQFFFSLFSARLVHLSEYGKKLFFSVPGYGWLQHKPQTVMYGGVEKVFTPISSFQRQKLRKTLDVDRDAMILLMVGRVEKRKNYVDAVRVLHELVLNNPKEKIYMYYVLSSGKANDFTYLQEVFEEARRLKVGKHIRVLSGVERDTIVHFFQIADAFLMLSQEQETFGLVTLEALACNCPVFGYAACATPEVVGKKNVTFLSPSGDFKNVATMIEDYYFNHKQVKKYDFKTPLQRFTWEKSVKRMLA